MGRERGGANATRGVTHAIKQPAGLADSDARLPQPDDPLHAARGAVGPQRYGLLLRAEHPPGSRRVQLGLQSGGTDGRADDARARTKGERSVFLSVDEEEEEEEEEEGGI